MLPSTNIRQCREPPRCDGHSRSPTEAACTSHQPAFVSRRNFAAARRAFPFAREARARRRALSYFSGSSPGLCSGDIPLAPLRPHVSSTELFVRPSPGGRAESRDSRITRPPARSRLCPCLAPTTRMSSSRVRRERHRAEAIGSFASDVEPSVIASGDRRPLSPDRPRSQCLPSALAAPASHVGYAPSQARAPNARARLGSAAWWR